MKIAWEKYRDAIAGGIEDNEELNEEEALYKNTLMDAPPNKDRTMTRYIVTQAGVIPVGEHNCPSKYFNLWLGHTDFGITRKVSRVIQGVSGVETLDIFTPYRFRIGIGFCFDGDKVRSTIEQEVSKMLAEKEKQSGAIQQSNITDVIKNKRMALLSQKVKKNGGNQ